MTTSQTPAQNEESTQIAPASPREPASAGGPDPREALAAFLQQLLEFQCGLVGGAAGVVFLGAGASRSGGVAAMYRAPNFERVTEGADPLSPTLMPTGRWRRGIWRRSRAEATLFSRPERSDGPCRRSPLVCLEASGDEVLRYARDDKKRTFRFGSPACLNAAQGSFE